MSSIGTGGVEKLVISKMLVEGSNRRIFSCDLHAGIATSGLAADGRQIVNRARAEAANFKNFFGDAIPGEVLCDRIASYKHLFTLYGTRPYGVGTLLAVYDEEGPQLYQIEASGVGMVPADLHATAETAAKAALEDDDDD
eukprot:gene6523-7817_t